MQYSGEVYTPAPLPSPRFNPEWLHTAITGVDADQVRAWLIEHGVILDNCAGFDYNPLNGLVRVKIYRKNDKGENYLMPITREPATEDFFFTPLYVPPIVSSCTALHDVF